MAWSATKEEWPLFDRMFMLRLVVRVFFFVSFINFWLLSSRTTEVVSNYSLGLASAGFGYEGLSLAYLRGDILWLILKEATLWVFLSSFISTDFTFLLSSLISTDFMFLPYSKVMFLLSSKGILSSKCVSFFLTGYSGLSDTLLLLIMLPLILLALSCFSIFDLDLLLSLT